MSKTVIDQFAQEILEDCDVLVNPEEFSSCDFVEALRKKHDRYSVLVQEGHIGVGDYLELEERYRYALSCANLDYELQKMS